MQQARGTKEEPEPALELHRAYRGKVRTIAKCPMGVLRAAGDEVHSWRGIADVRDSGPPGPRSGTYQER
jgi:hypothetical protein